MRGESLELGTTLGWDRSQMHKSIPKISQLWGGVVQYNLAKKKCLAWDSLIDQCHTELSAWFYVLFPFLLIWHFVPIPFCSYQPSFCWTDLIKSLFFRGGSCQSFVSKIWTSLIFYSDPSTLQQKNVHILPQGVVWRQFEIFVLFFENEQHPVYPLTRKKDQQTMLFLLFNPCYWN